MCLPARCAIAITKPAAADKDVYDFDGQKNAPADTKRIVFIATHGTHGGIGNHEFLAGSLYLVAEVRGEVLRVRSRHLT